MRRSLPYCWSETCLFVAVLMCGCQHNRSCCTPCGDAPAAVAMGVPVAATSDSAPAAADAVNGGETTPTQAPTAPTPAQPALPSTTDPMLNFAPPAHPSDSSASAAMEQLSPASYQKATTAAPAAASLPAGPHFGHDANYLWLVGTLDYSRIQQAWLLRYVPVEEEDRYGGCVTLVAANGVLHFKRGQSVRVEGSLIDPESQQLRPAFQVRKIRAEEP